MTGHVTDNHNPDGPRKPIPAIPAGLKKRLLTKEYQKDELQRYLFEALMHHPGDQQHVDSLERTIKILAEEIKKLKESLK